MSNNFYDTHYYGKTDGPLKKIRDDLLRENLFYKSIICPEAGKKILDVGCGGGLYLNTVKDSGADLWGIDISENAVSLAKRRMEKPGQIICQDADPLPFDDEAFDYVTAWGTIEHFPNVTSILKEMVRVTREGGMVVVSVPNVYYYKYVWDTFRKGSGPVKHQEIEMLYSYQEWKDIIESSGLTVIRRSRHNKFNKSLLSIWIRDKVIPFYMSNHFVFVCKKVSVD